MANILARSASWLSAACLLACAAGQLCHARFVPPADGPLAFRRDRVPLDPATMTGLANDLVVLAGTQAMDTPASRRDAARMLGLALALNPGNDDARALIKRFEEGGLPPAVEHARRVQALARLWQASAWLETPGAGADGKALAACLLDVCAVADPRHPRAEARLASGETGKWDGWIQPIESYEELKAPEPDIAAVEQTGSTQKPTEPVVQSMPLPAASVRTVVWQKAGESDQAPWRPAVTTLLMTAEPPSESETIPTPLRLGPNMGENALDPINQTLRNLLAARNEVIPTGARVRINSREYEQAAQAGRPRPVAAAAAVLASAAVTGREPNGTILGGVDTNGNLTLTRDFWEQLRALDETSDHRLVLPTAARELLPSLLAMERHDFFIQHEVLLAKDFNELLDLTAKKPPPAVASAMAKFADIRSRGAGQDVRSYVANRFVRQRLDELCREAPWHASAEMLYRQASGNRPRTVSRTVLAAELGHAIEPVAWIAQSGGRELSQRELRSLNEMYDLYRQRLNPLEKVSERTDNDLLEQAGALAVALRTLERAARTRGEGYVVRQAVDGARSEFNRLYRQFAADLEAITNPIRRP